MFYTLLMKSINDTSKKIEDFKSSEPYAFDAPLYCYLKGLDKDKCRNFLIYYLSLFEIAYVLLEERNGQKRRRGGNKRKTRKGKRKNRGRTTRKAKGRTKRRQRNRNC